MTPADSPRERVLEAMVRVVADEGYAAATIGAVIERAGVSREEFDAMFASRDLCFLEAYEALLEFLVGCFREAFEAAAEKPWAARMTAGLRALLGLLAAEAEIARLALVDVATISEDARYCYRLAMDRFLPFTEQGRAEAPGGEALPEETARFAVGSGETMVFDEIRAGRAGQLPAILPDMVFAVTMPYLGPERAKEAMREAAEGA
jgi:AcrR family transcriptional regulator